MSEEIIPINEQPASREELDAVRMRQEMDVGEKIQTLLISDIEDALNIIMEYQEILKRLYSPGPKFVAARNLLNRYNLATVEPHKMYQILLDGRDITTHPDSIPGTAVEEVDQAALDAFKEEEEKWGDESYGISTVEIVAERDEDGDTVKLIDRGLCDHCKGSLDTGLDPYFKYVGTVTNTKTGHSEKLCDKCILKEFHV